MGTAKTRAQNKWIAKAYDSVNLVVPKGKREEIRNAADSVGESVNAYINKAIKERMEREGDA